MRLEVEDLAAGYIQGSRVLDGLSLSIDHGEAVALLGRNGMGKSTLLRTIVGHLKPVSGSIRLGNSEIGALPPYRIARAGIGYVPQGREIFADFTVEENLRMGVLGKKQLGRDVPGWAYELFPILGERRRQRAGTMSGGQQQQLAIMRALVGMPDLLLLDEPSEGIQPSIVHDIGTVLQQVKSIACVNETLDYHPDTGVSEEWLERNFNCPIELLGHGALPHRILAEHKHGDGCGCCNSKH